jgi:hypothetical protein
VCRRGGPAGGRPGGPAPAHAHAAPRGLLVHGVRRPAARSMLAGACCHTCSGSRARWARAGAATCPARRRRACGRSCAPAATSRATARPRARRRPGAQATRARASACERAPDRRGRPAADPAPAHAGSRSARRCPCGHAPARSSAAARPAWEFRAGWPVRALAPRCSMGQAHLASPPGRRHGDAGGRAPHGRLRARACAPYPFAGTCCGVSSRCWCAMATFLWRAAGPGALHWRCPPPAVC